MTQQFPYYMEPRDMKPCAQKDLYRNVCSSITHIIHNSPKMEITPVSISWWVDKQNVVYHWILFSNRKKWNTYTCYNMDKPQKHYSKWKNPNKKLHIIQVHLYGVSRKGKSVETENSKWLPRAGGESSRTSLGMGFLLGVIEML